MIDLSSGISPKGVIPYDSFLQPGLGILCKNYQNLRNLVRMHDWESQARQSILRLAIRIATERKSDKSGNLKQTPGVHGFSLKCLFANWLLTKPTNIASDSIRMSF